MGAYAPTVGIVGTTLGLINALSNLSEPEKLGHLIASAFVATLWGLLSANLMASAVGEGQAHVGGKITEMEMVIAGIVNIQSGANPRLVAQKLRSLLPPGAAPARRRRRPDVGRSRSWREGRRHKKHPPHEEHENRAWLVSYADMMAAAMVLFLVLFAMSQVDIHQVHQAPVQASRPASARRAWRWRARAPRSSRPRTSPVLGRQGRCPGRPERAGTRRRGAAAEPSAQADRARQSQMAQHAEAEVERLEDKKKLEAELAAKGMTDSVRFTIDERGPGHDRHQPGGVPR